MRAVRRSAIVAWAAALLAGCAGIEGLDTVTEQACAPRCGSGAMADSGGASDSSGAEYASMPASDSSVLDGPPEASDSSGQDSATAVDTGAQDAGVADAMPVDTGGIDSGAGDDGGCGSTATLQNCGACGQACAAAGTDGAKATVCSNATCVYQCETGYLDCNASVGYDPDGCECNTTMAPNAACCGTRCPILHGDGLGGAGYPNPNFYDCTASGAFDQQLALDACAAFTGNVSLCFSEQCTATGDSVVCGATNMGSTTCPCWDYQGTFGGKVAVPTSSTDYACSCPGSTGTGISTYSYN